MKVETSLGGAAKAIVVGAALVIVITGLRAAEAIVLPFLVAVFLATICLGPILWLQRKGLPSALAILLVIAGLVGIGFGMGAVVGRSANTFTSRMPFYQSRLQQEATALLNWLAGFGIEVSQEAFFNLVNPGQLMGVVGTVLAGLGALVANAFLILVTVLFLLLEASTLPAKLRAAMESRGVPLPDFGRFTVSLRNYLVLKTLVSLATGLIVAIWVWILGVDFPLLWGLLAFLLNYVPNIGSIIAAVPAVLLGYIQLGPDRALLVAVGYAAVNIGLGSLLEPRIMGQGMGLSTLVVFLSLVFWGWMFGGVGMILSIPLTMTLKIALETSEETRWVAILLDPKPPQEPAVEDAAQPEAAAPDEEK